MPKNNKRLTVIPKNLIKSVLGEVPFTAEVYWLIRHPDKTLNSRFSLKNLEEHIDDLVAQVKNIRREQPSKGKNVFIFATLHYWIEHAALTGMM